MKTKALWATIVKDHEPNFLFVIVEPWVLDKDGGEERTKIIDWCIKKFNIPMDLVLLFSKRSTFEPTCYGGKEQTRYVLAFTTKGLIPLVDFYEVP